LAVKMMKIAKPSGAESAEAAAATEAHAKRVRKVLRAVDYAAEIGIRTGLSGPL
jgi:hypothetical protein